MSNSLVFNFLATITLVGGAIFSILIILLIADTWLKIGWAQLALSPVRRYGLAFALIVALAATLGSLFFSEIAGLDPCKLCWFQRIFMYPQAVLIPIALFARERSIAKYLVTLSFIGAAFSAYHYYIQMNPPAAAVCSIVPGESCSQTPFTYYGYITIPMMALTAFALIVILTWLGRNKKTETP